MALGVPIKSRSHRGGLRGPRRWAVAGLALASASCVPATTSLAPSALTTAAPPMMSITPAAPVPAATPASAVPAEPLLAFAGRTELDRLRSLDCLAQAIYYEAGSESEDGQRAVAQVVLNRVRHPAWPDSVCGVVYQGPMRPGGGCQFTFTCDGALTVRPAGIAWARARALAAEALAGYVHAPVGLSTHYHTHAVFPAWAPRLQRTAAIGAHQFYRLPGGLGAASAFSDNYAGVEPFPRPAFTLLRFRRPSSGLAGLVGPAQSPREARWQPESSSGRHSSAQWAAQNEAEAMVREEYRQSGQWRDDAPRAITGR